MNHNKLSRRVHRRPRLDMSTILSSNFSRRSVASSAPPSESINLGKLESTKLVRTIDDDEEDEEDDGENLSLYYTAIASDNSSLEEEDDVHSGPLHVRDILFSAKKKSGDAQTKKGLVPTLLASDSDDSPHTPIRTGRRPPPRVGRRRSSILGRHEVVLITSESDDEEEEQHQLTPRTPVRKVEDWLISTSPIPSSPATPARVILSSSSSREASDNDDNDEVEEEEHPVHDYIEDMEDSEATSKNYVDIINPILGNLSLGDTTSKGGYSLMETVREEEEEEEEESEKSLEVEIIDIKAKRRLSRGVQVELSSSEDGEEEDDELCPRPSHVSVSVQAELDDDDSSDESDNEEVVPQIRKNIPIILSEDESSQEEEEEESRSKKDTPKKTLDTSSSDDSDQAFGDFISSVRKKYDFQPAKDEEKTQISKTPQKLNFSSDEDDGENSVPSLQKKKTLQSPVVIELSSDEEPSPPPVNHMSEDSSKRDVRSICNEDRGKKHASFLSSLSPDMDDYRRHPDAIKYVNRFESHKRELTYLLYKMFNEEAFEGKLPPDMEIEWNPRLRKTAGICTQRRKYLGSKTLDRSSKIGLSTKVLDSGDRLRDTLIHEMCHAAAWILSGYRDGHGPVWKSWAAKAMNRFPELPIIDRCHNYQIRTKYTYKCEKCGYSIGRHSKSVDTEKKCCGYCRGKFVLLRNYKNGERVSVSSVSSSATTPRTPNAFATFVKDHYKNHKKPGVSHGDVMKTLSTMFKATKL